MIFRKSNRQIGAEESRDIVQSSRMNGTSAPLGSSTSRETGSSWRWPLDRERVMRYEMKYLIPRSLIPGIRAFIKPFCKPDPHASGDLPEYTITTLQLDDPFYSLHYAKEREASRRFKLRVRTYGEIGSSMIFAEVKAKLDGAVTKTRTSIPFALWNEELVCNPRLPDCFENERQEIEFLHFKRLVWELGARPETLVRYIRESHVGAVDSYARVTFDRRLQYQNTNSWTDFGRTGIWREMDSAEAQGFGLPYSGVVFELKALSYIPLWMLDLVERFHLCPVGNCKYSTAIRREGAFRGYPADELMDTGALFRL